MMQDDHPTEPHEWVRRHDKYVAAVMVLAAFAMLFGLTLLTPFVR